MTATPQVGSPGTRVEGRDVASAVRQFAARFHAASGGGHHVASPLGAWMLLALCGRAASGARRDDLSAFLGIDVAVAAAFTDRLLATPHRAVAAAAAVWTSERMNAEALVRFLTDLPVAVERGAIPTRQQADDWAKRNTFGLIERFPIAVAGMDMILATALATKVTWKEPFRIASGQELGASSGWAGLQRVLRTRAEPGHEMAIVTTDQIGDVAVHTAVSSVGLRVTSVIADPGIAAAKVLAVAHDIAVRQAYDDSVVPRSLFDLPLGEGSSWKLTEFEIRTRGDATRIEEYSATLPAWRASSDHELLPANLGFAEAAAALAVLAGLPLEKVEARQSAAARYTRRGFEAAAVSAMGMTMGAAFNRDPGKRAVCRRAELRFGHPYAVIAVTTQLADWDHVNRKLITEVPWNGMPVFSAWISEPEEADEEPSEPGEYGDHDGDVSEVFLPPVQPRPPQPDRVTKASSLPRLLRDAGQWIRRHPFRTFLRIIVALYVLLLVIGMLTSE